MYDTLASMFNRHWAFWGGADCWPVIMNRAVAHTGGGKWLDLCCGTGHLLQMVHLAGYEATGVDLSESVLDYAQLNAPNARLVQGNIKKLDLFSKHNVVSCLGASINVFHKPETIHKILNTMTKYLEPGGMIVFDSSTREGMQCNIGREFHFNDDDGEYTALIAFDEERNIGEWQIHASFRQSHRYDQSVKCVEKLSPWDVEQLGPMIQEHGLQYSTMDADTLNEVDNETVRVVYFCTAV